MKIEMHGDDWTIIADAVIEQARLQHSARLLQLAAQIVREQGLTATANALDAEAKRLIEDSR